ncbi:hypothetical protein [Brevundimonas sp.]|uniref:hypothetical protein n=1 Tax=Brevundimonas sp. TaxID=1871086 RepID=UPI001A34315F|nr:hypothetical protein [Brevundimonas sp.]MBJ7485038.1 hypothetical protein [Brevundimonas sp.]
MTITNPSTPAARRRDLILRSLGWSTIAALLLAPAIAMQMGAEGVVWTAGDFVFAGIILVGAGIVCELVAWRSGDMFYRSGAVLGLFACVALVWVNGAVGIIGSEDEAANLLYLGVIGIALIGAVMARFEARGMVLAMIGAALAQVVVAVAALIAGWGSTSAIYPRDIIGTTVIFALIWLLSAALFRQAGRKIA